MPLAAHPREAYLEWIFPKGMRLKFAHLENENTVYDWQGAQVPYFGFDELTHFTEKQFFYMMSRNRSTSGVKGYIRATCNPDCDSWVRQFIDWWIDGDGYPIKERSGILRWFIRIEDKIIWGDSRDELLKNYGANSLPKSLTFIPSLLQDNKILMDNDPNYLANLRALSRVDRLRLEKGNWNVRASAGMVFQREWFPVVDAIPAGWISAIRFWDRAATKPNEANKDPDWTRGLKLLRYPDGTFVVTDLKSLRDTPGQVESLVRNVASHDTQSVKVMSQQDPGSAGVSEAEHFVRMLSGYDVRVMTISKDKLTRAKPVSAQCEVGNIRVLRAPWNDEFFTELENFPEGKHDDIVDVLSGAFNELCGGFSLMDAL
jgi:predicted phage terminase large subunit-like protein